MATSANIHQELLQDFSARRSRWRQPPKAPEIDQRVIHFEQQISTSTA
jgi:hypothetical protein